MTYPATNTESSSGGQVWTAGPHASVPKAPTGAGVEIVLNADADGSSAALARYLQDALPDAEVRGCLANDFASAVATAAGRCRILGVAGGDGSVNLAAAHAWRQRLPLLVLPAGRHNRFADAVGLTSVDQALVALRDGAATFVDVCRADDQVFLSTCRTEASESLARLRAQPAGGPVGRIAAGWHLVRTMLDAGPEEIVIDGRLRHLWLWCAGNGNAAHSPADGLIGVRAVDADRPLARLRAALALLAGDPVGGRFFEHTAFRALDLRARDGGEPLELVLDSEVRLQKRDVVLRKVRCALAVYGRP